jgi:hypothetical protein
VGAFPAEIKSRQSNSTATSTSEIASECAPGTMAGRLKLPPILVSRFGRLYFFCMARLPLCCVRVPLAATLPCDNNSIHLVETASSDLSWFRCIPSCRRSVSRNDPETATEKEHHLLLGHRRSSWISPRHYFDLKEGYKLALVRFCSKDSVRCRSLCPVSHTGKRQV